MRISTELPTETGFHVALWVHNNNLFTTQLYKPEGRPLQECQDRKIDPMDEEYWNPWSDILFDEDITVSYLTTDHTLYQAPF